MNAGPAQRPPYRPLTRVLVANRGEIALRVIATCRRRGLSTVAVFSDADEHSAFVAEADLAVRLPGTAPSDTYLRGDLIIDAALRAGADAVHPGYGFLSENAEFAASVTDAGLIWIGPDPDSIEKMGSKVESKRLMEEAGVPVLAKLAPKQITESDLPVLVKASSGGGGRGMRVVSRLEDIEETVAAASREAASAFGDPTVFCERYIPTGHHIEVQVFGDHAGNVWAVGERECSIQRRHQKVVEEAPAPLVERHGSAMRSRLYTAARSAAQRIGYVGAGTVEFLADDAGDFFFLEMNTRLQVEHPVTEATTGLDLVGLQLDIAAGGELEGEEPISQGHAIEVRLYAEDPADDWAPQPGPVRAFRTSDASTRFTNPPAGEPGVRLDAGVEAGEEISTHYDPMIAKLIGVAPIREAAARVLARELETMHWDGPVTNADLLIRVLREESFLRGDTATTYLEEHPEVFAPVVDADTAAVSAAIAAIAAASARASGALAGPDDLLVTGEPRTADDALAVAIAHANPRPAIGGWRVFHPDWRRRTFVVGDEEHTIDYRQRRDGWEISPASLPDSANLRILFASADRVRAELDGIERRFRITRTGTRVLVGSAAGTVVLDEALRYTDPAAEVAPGSLLAPMPGTVIHVGAAPGDTVVAGETVILLEAMKMEHSIRSGASGIVEELRVAEGDQVDVGMLLAVIADPESGDNDQEGGDAA